MGNHWKLSRKGMTVIIFDCYILAKHMLEENGLSKNMTGIKIMEWIKILL